MHPDLSRSRLTSATRRAALHRLAEERYDLIVVGGGITGVGVALDAASRGLRTALVERGDLASGTSRWSSKLVHGGLRYLASGQLGVAWESALERHRLLTVIAPHLVRPVPFLVPLDEHTGPLAGAVLDVGIRAGDALRLAARTPGALLPRPRRVGATEARALVPALKVAGLRGGIFYLDGQLEDDARFVVTVARTAAAYGADIVTACAASHLTARSVTLTDDLTGESFLARGHVVNATGVWAGEHEPSLQVTPSRGSHLVVRAAALGWPRAVVATPVPGSIGRFVFAIPQPDGLVVVGLTDEPAPGVDGVEPPVPDGDERFLLDVLSRALDCPLTSSDVVGRFAGLRPLIASGDGPTADVSRRHLLLTADGGPVTIAGGKLTTYRIMARDAVDAVVARMGTHLPCRTADLPLLGAASRANLAAVAAPEQLVRRFGTLAPDVAALADVAPELAGPVVPGRTTLGVELLHGALAEGALTADDLLARRTRLSLVEGDADVARPMAERALEVARELSLTPAT